jgi:predicted  nucleic acid-binding Zn-ribbon protein
MINLEALNTKYEALFKTFEDLCSKYLTLEKRLNETHNTYMESQKKLFEAMTSLNTSVVQYQDMFEKIEALYTIQRAQVAQLQDSVKVLKQVNFIED